MTTSDKFKRHSFKVAFKLMAKSVRSHILTFCIFWKSYCWWRLIWGLDHRSRSRRSRYILPGAGAAEQFYLEPEPEPEPECFPGAGAGAGADQKCHGSASLPMTAKFYVRALGCAAPSSKTWKCCTYFIFTLILALTSTHTLDVLQRAFQCQVEVELGLLLLFLWSQRMME